MEDVFSSNAKSIIQKSIDISQQTFRIDQIESFDFYFDIQSTCEWIEQGSYNKVALQFPDELLHNSVNVCSKLKEKCSNSKFFILADTSYGSCCVDVVAAEHYEADCIIHYGHSCLSLVDKLPVYYVFEKRSLDLNRMQSELDKLSSSSTEQKLVIIYDVEYAYLHETMSSKFNANNIFVSKIAASNHHLEMSGTKNHHRVLFSRVLPHDIRNDAQSYAFFYVGDRDAFLNPFLFYFNKNKFYKFNALSYDLNQIEYARTNRELMKRYYLIERARDSRIFGILIGTMSVANYNDAVRHASNILRQANRKYYSFLIGKLNCPKLNNFMEVDMYVLVACNENSLTNSKEFNKPIITVYELEMAFNASRVWGSEFVCDFGALLPGNEHFMPLRLSEREADVSLITGDARFDPRNTDENDNRIEKRSALVNRDDGLSVIHYSGAGEYLASRTWSGLEQNFDQNQIKLAEEGRKGIAAGYANESKYETS